MPRITFEVKLEKYSEHEAEVPASIVKDGDDAIKEYLIDSGHVDHALDYPSIHGTNITLQPS